MARGVKYAQIFLTAAIQTVALAQPASITGTISDPDGGIVKDAVIQATNSATHAVVRGPGSPKGEYTLALPAGTYDLAVAMPCCQYGSFTQSGVIVRAGESRRLNIRLPWGSNLGTLGDDPILLLNDFRDRAAVPTGSTPRTPEGKPDLSGIWINVYNPETPPPPLQPWAAELLRQRMENDSKDYPGGFCLPANASSITRAFPYKFVQTPSLIVVITESDTPGLRQIFMDGRPHPADWNPTWQGHSIGRWDGDTLVVDTTGFNDKAWLSLTGIPHTEKLHTVERIHRPDYGHIEVEITMEDSEAFTGPWKRTFTATLAPPGEEIMEFICNENNNDVKHYRGK
ncbi:MAG: carboxypeptidase-like regulatory domain-containing protein [Acidobacteriia bacterium]|nr:carboxypeptidase-like regulatory domain-containing protein [Terriglobia bacterium]